MTAKLNWLEQVGIDVAKGLKAAVSGAMGGASTVVNIPGTIATDVSDIRKMVDAAKTVEAINLTLKDKSLTGPEKLAAAAPQVQQVVMDGEFLLGKKVQNQDLFNKAMTEFTQAAVDLAQSLEAQPAQPVA